MFHGPGQALVHGRVLGVQPPGRGRLSSAGPHPGISMFRHLQRVPGQGGGPGPLTGLIVQPVQPERAQGLQHQVPNPAVRSGPGRRQQRAVHQVQHYRPGPRPGDRPGGLQRERAGKHRQPAEHPPLVLAEQPVTPVHRRRQRPQPRRRQPVPASQQREPVIQALQQLRQPQRLDPRRGQLNRQRHSVQPRHQRRHHRPGLGSQGEMRVHLAGTVSEQRHRFRPARPRSAAISGQCQRRQPIPALPGHADRLPARCQHPHIIRRCQQRPAKFRGRADHMLAVIQQQQ